MIPESRWITHSLRNPKPSLPTVTWPEKPPSKYFAVASLIRPLMRSRRASPMSIFLPDTRKDIFASTAAAPDCLTFQIGDGPGLRQSEGESNGGVRRALLL